MGQLFICGQSDNSIQISNLQSLTLPKIQAGLNAQDKQNEILAIKMEELVDNYCAMADITNVIRLKNAMEIYIQDKKREIADLESDIK